MEQFKFYAKMGLILGGITIALSSGVLDDFICQEVRPGAYTHAEQNFLNGLVGGRCTHR